MASKNNLGTYHTDADSYRKEWATLTGRSESEVYVPKGLDPEDEKGSRPPGPTPPEVTDRGVH